MSDRSKLDDAFGDAVYEVWRRGGNPDAVDRDHVAEVFYEDADQDRFETADIIASRYFRRRAMKEKGDD